MRNLWLIPLFGIQALLVSGTFAGGGTSRIIWDAAEGGRFDQTQKGYSVDNGRVVVDLDNEKSLCPTGLSHLASGRESVREVVFHYQVSKGGRYWLHIIWNPGGSGKEQFKVLFNGKSVGMSQLIDGSKTPNHEVAEHFPLEHESGQSEIQLRHLSGDGLRFEVILLSTGEEMPARVKPTLKFPTVASYSKEIGEPAVVFDGDYVRIYAPKRKEKEAKIIHEYLVRAYDELYRIVGIHTKYKIVVYPLPKSNPLCFGGTSECTIWHSDENLDFQSETVWCAPCFGIYRGNGSQFCLGLVGTVRMGDDRLVHLQDCLGKSGRQSDSPKIHRRCQEDTSRDFRPVQKVEQYISQRHSIE